MSEKDEAAERLIDWHFRIEPKTKVIYRFIAPDEDSPNEPIKLLEVNSETFETGRVDAFGFGPSGDVPYSTVTAVVTGSEMDRIMEGEIALPEGWDLKTAKTYQRRKRRAA